MLPNKIVKIFVTTVMFLGLENYSLADTKPFSIISTPWDKFTSVDGTGLYFDILNSIYGREKYTFNLVPWKRAQSSFKTGKGDALLGESGGFEYCHYPKWPIDADFFSAFHLKSKVSSWPGVNNLSSYKVIWVRGYEIASLVPGLKPFAEVDDNEQGIKMIIGGRADILIDYDQDLKDLRLAKKLNADENLVSATEISGGYLYICFRKGEAMDSQVKQFDEKMTSIQKSGLLSQLFSKYNRSKNYNKLLEYTKQK
jgi:ABC-type amino acid transport substrate-binding protein